MHQINILFLCTGNVCRSVMAEQYLQLLAKSQNLNLIIKSAGLNTYDGIPPSAETLKILKSIGIDASHYASVRATSQLIEEAKHIFVMTQNHRNIVQQNFPFAIKKTHLLTKYYNGSFKNILKNDIPDPIGKSEDFYNRVFQIIKESVENIKDLFLSNKPF